MEVVMEVIQKHTVFSHLTIPISLHDIPSSCGSWEHGPVVQQLDGTSNVESLIPMNCTAKNEPRSSINLVHQILRDG
jgi:hypothetical protein